MKPVATVLSFFLLLCGSAKAATIYNFYINGSGITSSGTVTLTQVGAQYEITGITGTYSDTIAGNAFSGTITGIVPSSYSATSPSTDPSATSTVSYDNLLYFSGSSTTCASGVTASFELLDHCGALFAVSANNATYHVNLFGSSVGGVYDVTDYQTSNGVFLSYNAQVTVSSTQPTVTPEPSTWLLTITGLLGVAGAIRQRTSRE